MAEFDQLITFLKVNDISRSLRFYKEILGLPQVYARDGKVIILKANASSFIGLVPAELPAGAQRSSALTLIVKDADAWLPRLDTAGVPNKGKPIFKSEFGIYVLYATDPDGNTVEFLEMRDPDWPHAGDHG
ncbi:VOC family protein [Aestuariivirga sp. YIM B02566]|uniref:VOC family protein n=1 Tax=Taklimakanibacter albus TaxID=2800327 RepID=A0ACC5R8M2_9HYPH|nr:VOC family protein [Aestuariivirga sp. YIM B02566]MBK1868996.1 VOC family protein [Aestuariivirga sp. YIM B02566]